MYKTTLFLFFVVLCLTIVLFTSLKESLYSFL
ncbi:hypothetical protein QFZ73_004458 [Peribacillus sp. V2I11]|nr:hypothetical protein [Bacillus sp. B2I3]MDQ0883447.1 hypothetical protein [Peribacillus sp. V2I11]